MQTFLDKLLALWNQDKFNMGFTYFDHYEIAIKKGKKYTKILKKEIAIRDGKEITYGDSMGSLVCFVNEVTGEIFKAAGWAAPAKHARGNINSETNGMEAFNVDGTIKYLK